jgi:heme exporter protein C
VFFNCLIGVWIIAGMILGFTRPPAQGLVTSSIMYFHVPMAIAMVAGFLTAAYQGARWLQTRQVVHDAKSFAFAEVGAWLGVIATTTGALWAKLNCVEYWSWDPQQIGIVAVLLTYAALFSLRAAIDDEEKRRDLWAVYAIVGAIAAVFWLFVFRRLMPTLHPPDTLLKSEPVYKIALWFNIAGYIMVLAKLAQLRAKLELAAQKVRDWNFI